MQSSTKYQLIVQREYFKNQQKTYAIDLEGETIEEARTHAKQLLYGRPDKWEGKLESWSTRFGDPGLKVCLDPEGTVDPYYGFLMGPLDQRIPITSATIVEVTGETLDIDAMQQELNDFYKAERQRLIDSDEYQQYLELQKKYG